MCLRGKLCHLKSSNVHELGALRQEQLGDCDGTPGLAMK